MSDDLDTRKEYVRAVSFLRHASDEAVTELAKRLQRRTYPEGALLFDVAAPSDTLYIVHSGEVEILTDDDLPVAVVRAGSVIGEIGFLTQGKRTVRARALTPVTVWALTRKDFDEVSRKYPELTRHLEHALAQRAGREEVRPSLEELRKLTLFQGLDDAALKEILPHLDRAVYPAGQVIYSEGDPANRMYIVVEGAVRVTEKGQEGDQWYEVGPGEFFGEKEILDEETRHSTAVALSRTVCWTLGAEDLLAIIAKHPRLALNLVRLAGQRAVRRGAVAAPTPPPTRTTPIRQEVTPPPRPTEERRRGGLLSWFHRLDAGTRLRLLALLVLLIWLVGVSVPYMMRETVNRNRMYSQIDHSKLENTVIGNSPAGVPLAPGFELNYPTPTATPLPTPTP
ncbi:MAG: cyclic nucleotide-binding domain-containing protein [Chloroflexi bacterium]|nr:cyclic nucleotide-binding domain-containing protein [Chloroflexota bacterium]